MAPEVHFSSKYSVQCDVFSLGMVFYFVLELVQPSLLGHHTPEAHFAALAKGQRPTFRATKVAYKKLITMCLSLNPLERPSSRELCLILRGTSSGQISLFSKSKEPSPEHAAEAAASMEAIASRTSVKSPL
jgi:serine/threonine protein kinase